MMPKTFLICPVRGVDPAKSASYVKKLEDEGWEVYWPHRDTDQDDPHGLRICEANRQAIFNADAIHIIWDGQSQGCLFDLGMAFMCGKRVIPLEIPNMTPDKSFQNVMWLLGSQAQGIKHDA
jgi:hypothetical protein